MKQLTIQELRFIKLACELPEGVFDFDNLTEEQFKEDYGVSPNDAYKMVGELKKKVINQLQKEASKKKQ